MEGFLGFGVVDIFGFRHGCLVWIFVFRIGGELSLWGLGLRCFSLLLIFVLFF